VPLLSVLSYLAGIRGLAFSKGHFFIVEGRCDVADRRTFFSCPPPPVVFRRFFFSELALDSRRDRDTPPRVFLLT